MIMSSSTRKERTAKGWRRFGVALALTGAMLAGTVTPAMGWGAESGDQTTKPRPPSSKPTTPKNPKPSTPGAATAKYYSWRSVVDPGVVQPGCAATDSLGQLNLGANFRYKYPSTITLQKAKTAIRSGSASMKAAGVVMLEQQCLYPPAYRDRHETAIVKSTATVSMTAPGKAQLATATDVSAWGRGDRSIGAIKSQTFARVDVQPTKFGRYSAQAVTVAQKVTVRHWLGPHPITGASYPDKIVKIGQEYITAPDAARGQLTCAGWQDGWSGSWSWTMDDCGPDSGRATFQCVPSGPATTVKGQGSRDITVMRDGESNNIVWQKRIPNGNFVQSAGGTTTILRSGTPWNTTKRAQPANKNDTMLYDKTGKRSLLKSEEGTGPIAGNINEFDARFVWASDKGKPAIFTPRWVIPGTTTVSSVVLEGFDSASGRFVTRGTQSKVSTQASCSGDTVKFSVVRPITTGGF